MQKTDRKLTALYARKSIACGGQTLSAFCRQIALFACFIAPPLYAHDGRVTFEGEILSDGTCKIETDSKNRTVTLPTVQARPLKWTAAKPTAKKPPTQAKSKTAQLFNPVLTTSHIITP